MFLYRRNIILLPSDYDGISLTKGLLSFDCYDNKTKCTLHCYNLQNTKPLTLGVAINKDLHKIQIEAGSAKNVQFQIDKAVSGKDDLSCVLIDVKNSGYDILLWGSSQISSGWKSSIQMMLDDQIAPKQENQDDYKEHNFDYAPKTQSFENAQEIYTYKDSELNEFLDKVIDMAEDGQNEQSLEVDTDSLSFYERINPQIEKMFEINKQENVLNEIIPNSKFCKVNFDDGTGYYVFGIIYEDKKPKYLCYGIPAQKNSQPPKELANLYQWLPIDTTDEDGDGFYMMYQDASTGKNISVDII